MTTEQVPEEPVVEPILEFPTIERPEVEPAPAPAPSEAETAAVARAEAAEAKVQEHQARAEEVSRQNQAAQVEQAMAQARQQYMEMGDTDEVAQAKVQGEYNVWQTKQEVEQVRNSESRRMEAALSIGEEFGVAPKSLLKFNSTESMREHAEIKSELASLKKGQRKITQNEVPEQQFDNNRGSAAGKSENLGMLDRELTDEEYARLAKRMG